MNSNEIRNRVVQCLGQGRLDEAGKMDSLCGLSHDASSPFDKACFDLVGRGYTDRDNARDTVLYSAGNLMSSTILTLIDEVWGMIEEFKDVGRSRVLHLLRYPPQSMSLTLVSPLQVLVSNTVTQLQG